MQNAYFCDAMKITRFKNIGSTNSYLQDLLDKGFDVVDNIVITDFQTSGKGQGRNVWQSEDGKNLLFSIALDMSFLRAEDQFFLTQMVSVAMIEVLMNYLPEDFLFIKWPNDIYCNDNKIAGVLISNEIKGTMLGTSIIGIGLNVNQTLFDTSLPNPISMKMITGNDYNIEEILSAISCRLYSISEDMKKHNGSATDSLNACSSTDDSRSLIVDCYNKHLYRYEQWALYEHEGMLKELMIVGYDKFGRLILKDRNDEEMACNLKEIVFRR